MKLYKNPISLFIVVLLAVISCVAVSEEKAKEPDFQDRLWESVEQSKNATIPLDVLYTKEVVTSPEEFEKEKQRRAEETEKMRKRSNNDTLTFRSLGIAMADGSEKVLSQTHIRIGKGFKTRSETKIYADEEKAKIRHNSIIISAGVEKTSMIYRIEHDMKQVWIHKGGFQPDRQVLRFGKVGENIMMEVLIFCNPKAAANMPKLKSFLHKGATKIEGVDIEEIECISIMKGQRGYRLFVDSNDLGRCRKIVWSDKDSGRVCESLEYKEFLRVEGSDEVFPRLSIRRYFNEEGKETKVETIKVEHVTIGEPISEDMFELEVPEGYAVFDATENPSKAIKQGYETLSEKELEKILEKIRKK